MKKHCLSLERMTAMPFQGNAKKPFLINDILKKSTTFCSYRYLSIINILIITIQKSHFSTPNYASSKNKESKQNITYQLTEPTTTNIDPCYVVTSLKSSNIIFEYRFISYKVLSEQIKK